MAKKDDWNLEGQMSIFDFLEPTMAADEDKTENKVINQLISDLEDIYPGNVHDIEYRVWEHVPNLGKRLWLCIEGVNDYDLTEIVNKYAKASLEVSITPHPHFKDDEIEDGMDLYISTMWTTKSHKPLEEYVFDKTPAEIWAEETGINDYWQTDIAFKDDKPVCKHSNHSCNKKELWKIAETLDNQFCPHVCCRFCSDYTCGARCNGAETYKKGKEEPIEQDMAAEPICTKAKECEAYPNGCGGTIEPCRFGGPYEWDAMPKPQPKEVIVKGLMDDGYCPECDGCQEDLAPVCRYCGQLLSWEHWKEINNEEQPYGDVSIQTNNHQKDIGDTIQDTT